MTTASGTPNKGYPALRDLSPSAQAAAGWFKSLAGSLRTCRLYHSDNPVVLQSRQLLHDQLNQNLANFGAWSFRISPVEILLGEEAVIHPSAIDDPERIPGKEEQLPFFFYRDGIRHLTFLPELPRHDFDALFDALLSAGLGLQTQDDLVTLLWQANTLRIVVESVPLSQTIYLSSRRPSRAGEAPGTKAGQAFAWAPEGEELRADIGQLSGITQGLHQDTFDDWPLPEESVDVPNAYAALTKGMEFTRTRFITEWTNERERDWTVEAPRLIRQVMTLDSGQQSRESFAQAVVTWLVSALQRGAWTEGQHALELLHELDPDGGISNANLASALSGLEAEEFTMRLDEASPDDQALFFGLAVAIGRPVLDLACSVMGLATKNRTRAAACTMLGYLCSDEPEALAPYLADSRWYVVRNTVFVLGQIGGSQVAPLLRTAAHHPEPRVRRQVIQSLGSIPVEESMPILLAQLDTRDPQLLASALNMMMRQKDPRITSAILKQLEAPDFESRSEDNQRTLFHALGEVAGDQAVPALETLLNKGGWFARRTTARSAAARTLARIGSPNALAVLHAGLRGHSEAVRQACLEATSTGGAS